MRELSKYCILVLLLFLTGCSVGPDYKPVNVNVAPRYTEAPAGWKIANPEDNFDKGKWWLIFNDPILTKLVEEVNVSNQNIVAAVASFRAAVAVLDQTKANFWPTIAIDASLSRQKTAVDLDGFNASGNYYNNYQINPTFSWSPDIFGAVRRAVQASTAGAEATLAQLADTRLSMQVLLAQTYFKLRAADLTQELLEQTILAYRRDLKITQNKYAAGIDSKLDIVQAETQLQNAQTQALDNQISRAQYEHAIAVLVNKLPEEFALKEVTYDLSVPQIPLQVPAQLLERRADIAQSERLVAQASANIGVAVAAYFPIVTLTANYGYSSNHFRQLFTKPTSMWAFGAALAETIFDGGARTAAVREARATYDQTVAQYRQTVLSAMQDVEDNLTAVRVLDLEAVVQNAAVASADKALQITLNQYNAGITDYLNVIIEQNIAYSTRISAIDIYSRRLVAAVSLIQSLGGGWDRSELNIGATSECNVTPNTLNIK